jgi:hypothetical protein
VVVKKDKNSHGWRRGLVVLSTYTCGVIGRGIESRLEKDKLSHGGSKTCLTVGKNKFALVSLPCRIKIS